MGSRGPIPDKNSGRAERRERAAQSKELVPATPTSVHPTTIPDAPSDLGAAGRECWRSLWLAPQMLTGDAGAIAAASRLEDEAAVLRATVQEHGPLLSRPVTTSRGEVVGSESYANPAIRELRRVEQASLALMRELGLSPWSRARLGLAVVEVQEKTSWLDDLRERRRKRLAEPVPEPGPAPMQQQAAEPIEGPEPESECLPTKSRRW
jgi:hypothetical protein